MTLEKAGTLVLRDARRNDYPDGTSDVDVLADVRARISLDDVVDYGDEDTEAYRVFLAHHQNPTRSQLCALIVALSGEQPPEAMPAHYRVWHRRILRGEIT